MASKKSSSSGTGLMILALIFAAAMALGGGKAHFGTSSAASSVAAEQAYAQAQGGYSNAREGCLNTLWTHESNWDNSEVNSSSGAYGIPQANPQYTGGTWGAFSEADWQGAIRWGIAYIAQRYSGDPCAAWNSDVNSGMQGY